MCGKFTAMYSWREVVEMSAALLEGNAKKNKGDNGDEAGGGNDEIAT